MGPKVLRFQFYLPTEQTMSELRSLMMMTFYIVNAVSHLRLSERVRRVWRGAMATVHSYSWAGGSDIEAHVTRGNDRASSSC